MLRRLSVLLLALVTFAVPASATWSICVVNRRTGEVAVASATCLANINLMSGLPLVRVGVGTAAIQSVGWAPGLVIIDDLMAMGATPQEMMDAVLAVAPAVGNLQIGIASMDGFPATYTGRQCGRARGGLVGQVGDWYYAIQGNVLSGSNVWFDCRDAFVETDGDTAERLMAAMQAARFAGGDGRCSCDTFDPTGCGSPPPSFEKSAHCGFMVVARMGDQDPSCSDGTGNDCAEDGVYYLEFNIKGGAASMRAPDPVEQLQGLYDAWRARKVGQADGILSTVSSVDALPADGVTMRTVTVRLVDLEGTPLTAGGDDVSVATVDGSPSIASVGPVVDNGDGTYTFELVAGTTVGTDRFVITADAGQKTATLYPYLEVRSEAPSLLHVGFDEVSALEAPDVPFVVSDPDNAHARYFVLASLTGTQPGLSMRGAHLPLNMPLFGMPGPAGQKAGLAGRLDANGRADATFVGSVPLYSGLVGMRIDWAALVRGEGGWVASEASGFDVVP